MHSSIKRVTLVHYVIPRFEESMMANFRLPGVVCDWLGAFKIDAGTMCRSASTLPGPVSAPDTTSQKKRTGTDKPKVIKSYAEHPGAVKNPLSHVGESVVLNSSGSPQCVELVKKLAGAPMTVPDGVVANGWQRGTALTEDSVESLELGTPIASGWSASGFYPNNSTGQHAGIFAGAAKDKSGKVIGFTIVEQYSGLDTIISRVVYFDPVAMKKKNTYFYRGKDYATVKW